MELRAHTRVRPYKKLEMKIFTASLIITDKRIHNHLPPV